ncbi:MAG TPA: MBL fold metallo-hydrolase [Anaerolineae bacterium]|nr:MBL fold metallo-hydrolase [Anaerolineae bacterium]HOQ98845.1 MBL fold metallo-hydrolase [Anaerolineae bacterium]HPL27069.1 MBL fold metallo-hydrolase [Anaerolineae bacterium]
MKRERVAEDVYVFYSDAYAQAAAGVVLIPEGAIVIDTLPFPDETAEILRFLEGQGIPRARFVVNTHFHGDHSYGTCLFQGATVISHRFCREALVQWGEQRLAEAKQQMPAMQDVVVRFPDVVFDEEMHIHFGKRTLRLIHLPGHTEDSIGVMVEGDRILFSGDAVMPVPYIPWGNREHLRKSLAIVLTMKPEMIVQGHGEILLRGEVAETVESSVKYLDNIEVRVAEVIKRGGTEAELRKIDIEACGRSRIPLDGLVSQLHQANLRAIYKQAKRSRAF